MANTIPDGYEVQRHKDSQVLSVDLCYPRNGQPRATIIEIGLLDVRAADSIQISYDFERDGWSIKQAAGWYRDQSQGDVMDWQEVAFIQAWARVPPGEVW